jgi:hypothetical protein
MNKDKLLSICNMFSGRCPRSLGLCDYISLTLNSLTLDTSGFKHTGTGTDNSSTIRVG